MEDYLICTEIYDNHIPNKIKNSGQKAFFVKDYLWEQGSTIYIGFFGDGYGISRNYFEWFWSSYEVDPLQKEIFSLNAIDAIKMVVRKRIQPLVNLNLIFVPDPKDADVRISFYPNEGSFSCLGNSALIKGKNEATMNFGWLDVKTILHEFGHLLGMEHEHQSPYSTVQWDEKKVHAFYKDNFNWNDYDIKLQVTHKFDKEEAIASDFDPLSIMLYYFSPNLTLNNVGTKQNNRLSGYDVMWIAKTYPITNGISPEEFYFNTYGIPLADSIAESDRLRLEKEKEKESTPESFSWWKIILIIFIVIFVLALIGFLVKFYLNKKNFFHYYKPVYHDDKHL